MTVKRCNLCREHKPLQEFSLNKYNSSGVQGYCKTCAVSYTRLYTYGVTIEQYVELYESQSGLCAICGRAARTRTELGVDHCHETNRVRGLLCKQCNSGLGMFMDNPELLYEAANYLLSYKL